MFVIIGLLTVAGSVVTGFVLEGGNASILVQPVEVLILFGIGGGAFLIANPPSVISGTLKAVPTILTHKSKTKADFLEILILMYQLFQKMKKEGLLSIEADVEDPYKSDFFKNFGKLLAEHHLINFLCDNLKVIISTTLATYELEDLMEKDIETHHHEAMEISHAVNRMGDAMPGLGIVAAVLGVVLTMGKIDKPPEIIGHSVAVALLGTFLGILMCYGYLGPISTNLEYRAKEDIIYLKVIKVGVVAFVGGAAPMMAAEFARRIIPSDAKPTFAELEEALKGQ